jgi:hypothetical protein
MTQNCAFVVVPFQRIGSQIGASRVFVFSEAGPARAAVTRLSAQVPGVALLERRFDEATGDDVDTLLETTGAVPPDLPASLNWTMRLN